MTLHACFRKLCITNKEKKPSAINVLMNEKRVLIKDKNHDKERVVYLEKKISESCEEREWGKLVDVLGSLKTDTGGTNNTNVWKEMRKAFPKKTRAVPIGVENLKGKLITNPKENKGVILKHFLESKMTFFHSYIRSKP